MGGPLLGEGLISFMVLKRTLLPSFNDGKVLQSLSCEEWRDNPRVVQLLVPDDGNT